jgi:serine/threonine protein phosphatase PrpC
MKHHPDLDSSARALIVDVGQATHQGMVRFLNEDRLLVLQFRLEGTSAGPSFGLYAVADGVGGHQAGEVASDLAIRVLAKTLINALTVTSLEVEPPGLDQQYVSKALCEAVKAAHKEVYAHGKIRGTDMGTTIAAALIINNRAYIANVGDSRVYLLEGKQLRQITTDHSIVMTLLAAGLITAQEIYTHPHRNIITRSLGIHEDVEVDIFEEELKSGNSLLICSDCLWEIVRDDMIKEILLKVKSPQSACEQLLELANQSGGIDNISVILVRVSE